jgi:hypothetical protein
VFDDKQGFRLFSVFSINIGYILRESFLITLIRLGLMNMKNIKEESGHHNLPNNEKKLVARFVGGQKPNFERCIFLISVGKENFEEKALKAQLKLINSTFNLCLILVADTLQRYNFLKSDSREEKAYSAGTNWIERYDNLFKSRLTKTKYTISRWDEWIGHSTFLEKKVIIEGKLKEEEFCKAMDLSVEEYTKRRLKQLDGIVNPDVNIRNDCKDYLIEECAVLLMLGEKKYIGEKKYNCIVYPGKATPILGETIQLISNQSLIWQTLRLQKKAVPLVKKIGFFMPETQGLQNNSDRDLATLARPVTSYLKDALKGFPESERPEVLEEILRQVGLDITSGFSKLPS